MEKFGIYLRVLWGRVLFISIMCKQIVKSGCCAGKNYLIQQIQILKTKWRQRKENTQLETVNSNQTNRLTEITERVKQKTMVLIKIADDSIVAIGGWIENIFLKVIALFKTSSEKIWNTGERLKKVLSKKPTSPETESTQQNISANIHADNSSTESILKPRNHFFAETKNKIKNKIDQWIVSVSNVINRAGLLLLAIKQKTISFFHRIVNFVSDVLQDIGAGVLFVIALPAQFFNYIKTQCQSGFVQIKQKIILLISSISNFFNTLIRKIISAVLFVLLLPVRLCRYLFFTIPKNITNYFSTLFHNIVLLIKEKFKFQKKIVSEEKTPDPVSAPSEPVLEEEIILDEKPKHTSNFFTRLITIFKNIFTFKVATLGARLETQKKKLESLSDSGLKNFFQQELWHSLRKISQYQYQWLHLRWFVQLREASQFGGSMTTLIASFVINLLSLAFPLSLMQMYDRVIPNQSFETMTVLTIVVCCALLLEMILRIARSYINLWSDTKFENTLSQKAFARLMDAPLPVYEKSGAGMRLKQLNTLDQLRGFYNNQLFIAVTDLPFIILFLVIIAYLSGWLFLVPVIMLVLLSVLSYRFLDYWEPTLIEKVAHESRENNFVIDVLNNIHTVKSMNMESLLVRRYERLQLTGMKVHYKTSVETGDLITLKMIASQVIVILIAIFGALYVIHGAMAIGALAACTLLVGRIMQPVNRALSAFNRWKTVNVIRQQLETILTLPVEDSSVLPTFGEFTGKIELRDVWYRYDEKSKWILQEINLIVPPRSMIAILADERSGKTTFINMLATVLAPTRGEYFLDAKNVTEYQLAEVRKEIAYLSQVGELFRGTIMDNLSGFNPENENAARQLAHILGLDGVIAKLPSGFDTLVGDRAVESLPRGVVNRMTIVRALSHKPKMVLFDEANMNLDLYSNEKLIELLKILNEVATVVIISQHTETLKIARQLYRLKEGRLEEVQHAAQ